MQNSDLDLVSDWMDEGSNYKWFDFGAGKKILEKPIMKIMLQRDEHDFKVFTSKESGGESIGMVALSNISLNFKTATLVFAGR